MAILLNPAADPKAMGAILEQMDAHANMLFLPIGGAISDPAQRAAFDHMLDKGVIDLADVRALPIPDKPGKMDIFRIFRMTDAGRATLTGIRGQAKIATALAGGANA